MLQGIDYLREKLRRKKSRVRLRYKYFEQHNRTRDFGISSPPQMRLFMSVLGWASKSVNSISDRLTFQHFSDDALSMSGIFDNNNKPILTNSGMLSALIASCSFIYITTEDGVPRMRIIDGGHATGILSPTGTMMLSEGYAVLDYDQNDTPIMEAYCTPGLTQIYEYGKLTQEIPNVCEYPLLVPLIHRSDAVRPFGHSRISPAVMSIQDEAVRCIKRGSVSSEFGAFPQRYVLGLSPDAEKLDSWNAAMSTMLTIRKDQDGTVPTMGQFTSASPQPHIEMLKMLAGQMSAETGLSLTDLGIESDNPSSAESIKATHENLRLAARKAQDDFSVGFKNAGFLAACLRDNQAYDLGALADVKTVWAPIFEADASALAAIGDALYKINEISPGYVSDDMIAQLTGIERANNATDILSPAEIDEALQV